MKIFTIKRVIGLAAIGGAVAYARKQGGFKKAFEGLVDKKDQFLGERSSAPQRASSSYRARHSEFGEKTTY